ncbi:MAG: phosphoadenosine phosphosulfate reductase family protein, partial [Haloplanus sp.]
MSEFPDYLDVDYTDGEGETPADYPALEDKIEKAISVTRAGLERYETPAVMWTGGKDSTLTLYFIKEVAEQFGLEVPPAVFIDHYQHFDAIHDFVEEHGLEPGDDIPVADLSEHNQHHIRNILEYEEDSFPFLLDTYVGNHLLKTVALNDTLEEYDIDGVISGVRWDEQEARADETFFSPRHDPDIYPPHDRVQPILQFAEPDVWDAFWNYVVPDTV